MVLTSCIDYSKELNTRQFEAVFHKDGPLLVIAGAGSGKTRTLTYRVVRLVEENISPASILLLTFTRKAADEMLHRARLLLDNRCDQVSGGTFHAFSNILLRRYSSRAGVDPHFTILDRADSQSLIAMVKKELGDPLRSGTFPKTQAMAQIFSKSVNREEQIHEVIFSDYPHFIPSIEPISSIYRKYCAYKSAHHLLDFDDLLTYARLLLEDHPDIRERISNAYRYIMVDEYQDTNTIQADILYRMTCAHQNIMAVGDDSQSIYAFRGANYRNIMEFPQKFHKTVIIRLEENYRSLQPILNLTNAIIDSSKHRYQKSLFTRKKGGSIPSLISTETENDQSRFVVKKIIEYHRQGVPLGQMAVLFRASFHSFDLEIELNSERVPFIKVGGFQLAESAHIKDFLAHLKVMANPNDRISWFRILMLLEKIGSKNAGSIFTRISETKSGIAGFVEMSLSPKYSKALHPLKELFKKIAGEPSSLVTMGEMIMNYYLPILEKNYDDHPRRAKEIEHVLSFMERYPDLEAFITDMALEPPNTSSGDRLYLPKEAEDRLILSTVHSAKGLEWRTVFIIWALDGRFPTFQAVRKDGELEEELRLMYVAATRAKDHLFFIYPRNAYDRTTGMVLNRPSRFLEGIPESLLKNTPYHQSEKTIIIRRKKAFS